jgi:hypothetical protein
MSSFRVLMPVAWTTSDGQGMTCFKVGSVVNVDDAQAKGLVAEGKLESVKTAAESKG